MDLIAPAIRKTSERGQREIVQHHSKRRTRSGDDHASRRWFRCHTTFRIPRRFCHRASVQSPLPGTYRRNTQVTVSIGMLGHKSGPLPVCGRRSVAHALLPDLRGVIVPAHSCTAGAGRTDVPGSLMPRSGSPRKCVYPLRATRCRDRPAYAVADSVVDARSRRARRPRSPRSTRPASAAAASRAAKSNASSKSGPAAAASCPMSRRIVTSVLEAIRGSVTPSIQTRVRRPSPRSSPVIRSSAKMRSARANLPKPRATIRVSDAT